MTAITHKGNTIRRPGVYSDIKSGIKNPPSTLSHGNICIIDTGELLGGFAAGSGINGANNDGVNSIYSFDNIDDFRAHVKGGYLWLLAEPLFFPNGRGSQGVSTVFLVKPATTTASALTMTFENLGETIFATVDEGTGANGVDSTGLNLKTGYATTMRAGTVDPAKFVIDFWVASYRGVDSQNGGDFNNIDDETAKPIKLISTPEMVNVSELITFATTNVEFLKYFTLTSSTPTGAFDVADLTTFAGNNLFAGATETYNATDVDDSLAVMTDVDNTFFLTTDNGDEAINLENTKVWDYCINDAKYDKYMIVGGGDDNTKFRGTTIGFSEDTAEYYGSTNDLVIVVHGAVKIEEREGAALKVYDSLYKTCAILGRICGVTPQTPPTLKTLNFKEEVHNLTKADQEHAIENGILYSYRDFELTSHVIGLGINSLLANEFLVNEDGTSPSIAVKRIVSQINKELQFFGKRRFFAGNEGPNRNIITSEDVKAWTETFLGSKIANSIEDNLIIRFQDVVVTIDSDNYEVTYAFVPNFEVNRIIFTGFILDK